MRQEPLFLLACMLLISAACARASCGSASCPLDKYRYTRSGMLQLGFVYEYINQNEIFVGSSRSFVGAVPQHHDEVQTINARTIFEMGYGLSNRTSLSLILPFVHREHSHIHHHQGEDVWESWNFSGMGDLVVEGRYVVMDSESMFGPHVSMLGGVKLPTGVTDARNGEGETGEVPIQPGTGATDIIVGTSFRQNVASVPTLTGEFSALPLTAAITYLIRGTGTGGYRFGNTLVASVGSAYQVANTASILLQINGQFEDFADVGTTSEPRENTGGTWIFVSPGFSVNVTESISAYSYLQFPIYRNVHGIQQAAAMNLQFGLSANVNVLE